MPGRAIRWTLQAMPLLVAVLCLTVRTARSEAAATTGASGGAGGSTESTSAAPGTPPLVVERRQTRVLFLHSHGPDDGYTTLQTQGIKEALEERAPGAVIGYHEYLFLSLRGEDDAYHHSLTKLLQKRYAGLTIDLVAITDTRALEFWFDHMQAALPGVPAVFSGANTRFDQLAAPDRNITGAMEHTDIKRTIALIRSLRPATRHLAVLTTDTFFGRRMKREIEDDLRAVEPGLRVTFSLPTVLEDCLEPFNAPDPADALLFVSAPVDGPGGSRAFAPQWIQSRVPGGVPVFCLFDGALGPDCIGGVVSSGKQMGRIAGQAAARILYDNVKPSDIPIDPGTGSVLPMFRWDAMRKWGITQEMLPKGSVIVGRPDSWLMRHEADIYRWTAISATTVAFALGGVIWGLVVARRRRRCAEIALHSSELRLRHAVHGANLGTWECDVGTGNIVGSDLFNDMYGIRAGQPFLKAEGLPRIHPEDRAQVAQAWYACIEGKGPYRLTYRYMMPSGEYRWFRVEGDLVRDDAGKPSKLVGVSADITEEHEASRKLAESQERIRLMASTLGEVFWVSEPDGWTFRYVSEAWETLWGRPRSAVSGHALETLISWVHPDDRESMRLKCGARPGRAEPMNNSFRVVHPDGGIKWINCKSTPVFDDAGNVTSYVGVQRDITDRMDSRLALEESQRRLAEVIRTAPLAIIEWDDQWRCTRWDGLAEAMFGWNAKEVLGRTHDDIRFIHPDDAEAVRRTVAAHEVLRSSTFRCTNRHYTKSGEVRICEWTKANKYDENGKRVSTLSMVSDVTEREESRRLQALSDERYRLAVRAASDIIWDWDIAEDRIEWSDAAKDLPRGSGPTHALTIAEWIDHLYADDRERVRAGFFGALHDPAVETWRDEYRMAKGDGTIARFTDQGFIVRDASGRAVRMVGAMSDVTATREAVELLAAGESRLRAAMTAAGLGTFDVDLATGRMEHDDRTGELFGLPPGGRIPDFEARKAFFHPDDVPDVCERERLSLRTGQDYRCEARVLHPDGQYRWILGQASIIKDSHGAPVRAVGVVGDIHERKTADEALRFSEERFREIARTVDQAFWIRSLQTREYEYLSPAVARMLGMREEELPRHLEDFRRYVHPDDIKELVRGSREWAEAGFPDRLVQEYRLIRPDGSVRWWRSKAFAGPRGADGKPTRLLGTTEDVTDRVEASQRLTESEQKFRQIAETIPQVFWTADPGPEGLMRYASDAVEKVFGIGKGRVEGSEHGWSHLIHPDDRAAADQTRIDWHAAGCPGTYENHYRIIRADGELRHILNRGYAVRDEQGRVLRITGLAEDITEREVAHQRLTESERRFREMAENIDQVFWVRSIERPEIEYVSPATQRLWGVEPAALTGSVERWRGMIHPDDRDRVRERVDRWTSAGAVGPYEAEFRIVTPAGETRWVRSRAAAIGDTGGPPTRIVGVSEDITERELAHQRLSESERRFREMAENIDQVFWVRTVDPAETLYLSPATKRLWGFDPSDMTGTVNKWREMIHPDDRERVVADIGRWFAGGAKGTYANEYRFVLSDGSVRWVSNRGTLVPSRDSLPTRMVGVSEDITARKNAELALAQTTEMLERTGELAKIGGWSVNLRTMKLSWTLQTFRIAEIEPWTEPDLEGGIHLFAPEAQPVIAAAVQEAIDKGTSYDLELPLITAKGNHRWVKTQGFAEMRDGKAIRIYGTFQDITSRKASEIVLANTLRTQRLLLSELDHRVKNNLAGLLALVDMSAARERSVPGFAEAMRRRVGAMVDVHAVLSSARWEPVDLSQMVSVLAPADVPGRFAIEGPHVRIPATKATPLGMILQELLSNSEKYGALSVSGGEVHLRWTCEMTCDAALLTFHWTERGGPPIESPPVGGLGTSLIEGFARYELRGWADLQYPRIGASHTIRVDITMDSTTEARQGASSTGAVLSTITTGV